MLPIYCHPQIDCFVVSQLFSVTICIVYYISWLRNAEENVTNWEAISVDQVNIFLTKLSLLNVYTIRDGQTDKNFFSTIPDIVLNIVKQRSFFNTNINLANLQLVSVR